MTRRYLIFFLLLFPVIAYSHPRPNQFDYSIVFIGCFEDDIVSLSLNKVLILDKYKVENKDSTRKGHLSLTQYDSEIKVYYSGEEIKRSKIAVTFFLEVDITINGKLKKIKLDLRKGKVILIDHVAEKTTNVKIKKIRVEQIDEPVIFM